MSSRRTRRHARHCSLGISGPPRPIACAWLPHLGTDLEYQRHPELAGQPLVLIGYPAGSAAEQVLAVAHAPGSGLAIGMPSHAAISRCPDAISLRYDAPHYRSAFGAFLLRLDAITPCREPLGVEAIYLDLAGLPDLDPDDPWQVKAAIEPHVPPGVAWRLGIGGSRFASWCAAHQAKPGVPLHIPPADTADFLERLPISLLPADQAFFTQAHLLGLCTLGSFAQLHRGSVLSRFGWEGEELHRLAAGDDRSPLVPFVPLEFIREALTFDEPAATVAEFDTALGSLVRRLWSRPDRPRGGIRQLALYATLEQGSAWDCTLTLRRAYEQWVVAYDELRRRLEGIRPQGNLLTLSVEVTAASKHLDRQLTLFFGERERRLNLISHALDELTTRLGHPGVYRLMEVNPSTPIQEHRWRMIEYEPYMTPGQSGW